MSADAGADRRAGDFFDAAWESFACFARAGGTASRDYLVAGLRLRINVAKGVTEQSICRALAHLTIPAGQEPDLTVSIWDSDGSGLAPLKPAWTPDDYGRHGAIAGFNSDRYHTAVQFEPIVLRMLDRTLRRGIYWTRAACDLPHWEIGAPLRPLLHEWLRGRGRLPVHGGAVGNPEGGVFLAGAGGSGKSNLALASLYTDLFYASDDFCVLTDTDAPEWRAHSLYCTGKVDGGDLARHPRLISHVSNPGALEHEKAIFFVSEFLPEKLIRTMPMRAIVMPRVAGRGVSELIPASGAAAQQAIAMSTIELSRWTGATTFAEVARFVRATPCFVLRIGDNPDEGPALISRLLERLSASRRL